MSKVSLLNILLSQQLSLCNYVDVVKCLRICSCADVVSFLVLNDY